eukprot:GFUD01008367.1.p1 GENE.GFUD01008367.1~~GFUD01008367.1.p1  ORF type:complete len:316 (-),score=69.27 GFUD01008367.1:90-1037(-)
MTARTSGNVYRAAFILFLIIFATKFYEHKLRPVLFLSGGKLTELTSLDQLPNVMPYKCLPTAQFQGGLTPLICLKALEVDKTISGSIESTGAWEYNLVNNVVKAMDKFDDATFLDIGSNIGMYSVVVAAMQKAVVAVDADPVNLAYVRKSLELGSTSTFVRMIYNSVSNEYTTLYPVVDDADNQGATRMWTKEEVEALNLTVTAPPLQSVTMVDILDSIPTNTVIVKLDIEGYECKALQPDILLGNSGKYIPYIFLEWANVVNNIYKTCPEYPEWLQMFYKGGYKPFNAETMEPLEEASVSERWQDMTWVHSSVH